MSHYRVACYVCGAEFEIDAPVRPTSIRDRIDAIPVHTWTSGIPCIGSRLPGVVLQERN